MISKAVRTLKRNKFATASSSNDADARSGDALTISGAVDVEAVLHDRVHKVLHWCASGDVHLPTSVRGHTSHQT